MTARGWYDWQGALFTGPAEADTCQGQVDRLIHHLYGAGPGTGVVVQALTDCGRRARSVSVGAPITCPVCARLVRCPYCRELHDEACFAAEGCPDQEDDAP